MKKLLLVFLTFYIPTVHCLAKPNSFLGKANTYGSIGDMGTLNLVDDGLYFSPMTNDFIGQTDKLLTGATRLSYLQSSADSSSLMLTGYWRSLTPVYKKKLGQNDLAVPIGRFADWAEVQASYLSTPSIRTPLGTLRHSLTLGLGHIGNKGIKEVHYNIHKAVSASLDHLDYHNQPQGWTGSFGSEGSYLLNNPVLAGTAWNLKLTGGLFSSRIMTDVYTGINTNTSLLGQTVGFEGRFVRQLASNFYKDIRPTRIELSSAIMLGETVVPAIKYVSPYLQKDNIRQIYLDISFKLL